MLYFDMADKVVMGDQIDGLRGLTRFSDNEGEIIWPAWRAELKQRAPEIQAGRARGGDE